MEVLIVSWTEENNTLVLKPNFSCLGEFTKKNDENEWKSGAFGWWDPAGRGRLNMDHWISGGDQRWGLLDETL